MNPINALLTTLTDAVLYRLAPWGPALTLLMISVIVGVSMAVAFRFTSPQQALRRVADQSRAQVLAINLFQDDLGNILGSLSQLLRYTALRLLYSLPPTLVMIVPLVVLLAQLARWYEYQSLAAGQEAVVWLELNAAAWPQCEDVILEHSSGYRAAAGPLRDETEHALYWRIRAEAAAPTTMHWRLGSLKFEKRLAVAAQGWWPANPRRAGPSWWDRLLCPGEPGFAANSPVQAIVVDYAQRSTPVFGFDIPWWLTFVVISMLAAVVARPFVKVQF